MQTFTQEGKAEVQTAALPLEDVVDVVWSRLEPLLPPTHRAGHPYDYDRRVILEAIVYIRRNQCGWRRLPSTFPPWKTVYSQFSEWCKQGIWDTIWTGLEQPQARIVGEVQL